MEDTGTRGGKKRRIEEVLEKVTTVEDASYGVAVKITKKEVRRHDEEAEEDEGEDSSEVDVLEYEKKTQKKIKELEVEFDVRVIEEENDFKAIRLFVTNYCQKQTFNSSEFVEIICSQPGVGSVIRQLDTVETLGFITVINMYHHRDKSCIKQIKKYILSVVPKESKSIWEKTLESPTLGLLVNDRIINVPHAIAPQLHQTMYEEVNIAVEEDIGPCPFRFQNYLYITSFGHPDRLGIDNQTKKKKAKSERKYHKAEDEIYAQHSSMSCTTPVSHNETRLLLVYSVEKIPLILNDIKFHVQEGYSW